MSLLEQLRRRFGRFAVPNVTIAIIAAQAMVYLVGFAPGALRGNSLAESLVLVPRLVLGGEVWRLVTFLAVPPIANPLCMFFGWYLFYLMGTALEHHWGIFRYNLYLLVGYLFTVTTAFLVLDEPTSNAYLNASVFLAFAQLYPNFELYLFFILPVKIKWLALLTWLGFGYTALFGDWLSRFLILASVGNFLLFFGSDIVAQVRHGRRRMAVQAAKFGVRERDYIHRCTECGITDRTHPEMDFRYCSQCVGTRGYCSEHLRNHEHKTTLDTASKAT
jgi:hypothetical protein